MKRIKLLPWIAVAILTLVACNSNDNEKSREAEINNSPPTTATVEVTTKATTSITTTTTTTTTTTVTTTTTEKTPEIKADNENSVSLSDIPDYIGSPYCTINDNKPFFKDNTTKAFEQYSDLDNLGRCGAAYANICNEIMPTAERGEIGSIKPTGWESIKYDWVDGKYLYNRCHLIGYQLAGENANEKNLITGTRYMNVEGMLPFENMVHDYVKETDNHVLYRVTPLFDGDNLLANGVLMEARSVEDDGKGIEFNVFCYNVQPDVEITYSTGASKAVEKNDDSDAPEEEEDSEEEEQYNSQSYVVNTNTGKFHYPSCSSAKKIKSSNRWDYDGSRDELIGMGYVPCKNCNP